MAAIGSTAQRSPSTHSGRGNAVFRRRLVVGVLSVLSLALVTVYFRESDNGFLHSLQSTGASVLRPFEVAADRIASPFEDAGSWFGRRYAGARVPTLRQYLERVSRNHQKLVLEIKNPQLYPGIERQTLDLLNKEGWLDGDHLRRPPLERYLAEDVASKEK